MNGQGVLAGLSHSAFLADLDKRDKSVWRFLATLFLGLLGGVVAGVIIGVVALFVFAIAASAMAGDLAGLAQRLQGLVADDGRNLQSALFLLTLVVSMNGPIAIVFILIAALFARRRMLDYVTAAPRIRWRLLLVGVGLSGLVLAPLMAADFLFGGKAPTPPLLTMAHDIGGRGLYAGAAIALLIPAAAAEEVLFRGWLLRQMGAVVKNPWILIVVNGIAFSAIHLDFNPDAFLTRALMGAGFAYMTLRLGGIEFSTGAHAANNIMIVLFLEPLTLKAAAGTNISIGSLAQDALLVGGYVVITELVARLPALRRWTGVDLARAQPPRTAEALS